MRPSRRVRNVPLALALLGTVACDTPHTQVIVENAYPTASGNVVYRAFWEADSFTAPIAPGSSSDPEDSLFASANTAYAVLAPGWDAASGSIPTSLVVLQSRSGFALAFDKTLTISISDATFAGNCSTGSVLSQADADFITHNIFAADFVGLHYDAATCTTSGSP